MKDILIIALTMFLYTTGYSQEFKFMLYGVNPCTKKVQKLKYFGLVKDGKEFTPKDSTGILLLSEKGVYKLDYVLDDIDVTQLNKTYNIRSKIVVKDTIKMVTIKKCLEPTTTTNFIGYCCCDKKCDGEQIDYYSNGNKRIEGCFVAGKPKGKLIFYYPSGSIRKIEKYNKKGILIKTKEYKDGEKNK